MFKGICKLSVVLLLATLFLVPLAGCGSSKSAPVDPDAIETGDPIEDAGKDV